MAEKKKIPPIKAERRRRVQEQKAREEAQAQQQAQKRTPRPIGRFQKMSTQPGKFQQYMKDRGVKPGKIEKLVKDQRAKLQRRLALQEVLDIIEKERQRILAQKQKQAEKKPPTPVVHPPVIKQKKEEKPREYKEGPGRGFKEKPVEVETGKQRAPQHRENAIKSWINRRKQGFLGRLGIGIRQYQKERLERKIETKEIIPVKGKKTYYVPDSDREVTEAQEYEEIKFELDVLLPAYERYEIDYTRPGQWEWVEDKKELKPEDIEPIDIRNKSKIRILFPPPHLDGKKLQKWLDRDSTRIEKQLAKMLPGEGEDFEYNGRTIHVNPPRFQFERHQSLNKNYNIPINLWARDKVKAQTIVDNSRWYYNRYVGRYIDAIMMAMRRYYSPHFISCKFNFNLHMSDGGIREWNEPVARMPIQNYSIFKNDATVAMMHGFQMMGTYQGSTIEEIELVFAAVSFTTQDKRTRW